MLAIARSAVTRATDPELVRLDRIVVNESGRFSDLLIFGKSTPLSPRVQVVMDLLQRHQDAGSTQVDDIEIAAEQFLAMVSMMPARLAAAGVHRSPEVDNGTSSTPSRCSFGA